MIYKNKIFHQLKRALSISLLCCLLNVDILYANPSLDNQTSSYPASLRFDFQIPSDLGSFQEGNIVDQSQPVIWHIQTLHGSYEVSDKVRKLIRFLKSHRKNSVVFVEGASSKLEPSLLHFFSSKKKNRSFLDQLTKEGFLTGADLAAYDLPETLFLGIEDPSIYQKQYKLFQRVLNRQSESQRILDSLKVRLDSKSRKLLRPDQFHLLQIWIQSELSHVEPYQLWKLLRQEIKQRLNLDLTQIQQQFIWPQASRVELLSYIEEHFNPHQFQAEMQEICSKDSSLCRILRSIFDSPNKLSRSEIEQKMSGHQKNSVLLRPNSSVRYQLARKILESELDVMGWKKEKDKLMNWLLLSYENREVLLKIARRYEHYHRLHRLLHLELTPEDWALIQADLRPWVLQAESIPSIHDALKFYEIMEAREKAFAKKIQIALHEKKASHGILISGGFHRPGIKKQLQERKINWIGIMPHLQNTPNSDLYHALMLRQATLERASFIQFLDALNAQGWPMRAETRALKNLYLKAGGREWSHTAMAKNREIASENHNRSEIRSLPSPVSKILWSTAVGFFLFGSASLLEAADHHRSSSPLKTEASILLEYAQTIETAGKKGAEVHPILKGKKTETINIKLADLPPDASFFSYKGFFKKREVHHGSLDQATHIEMDGKIYKIKKSSSSAIDFDSPVLLEIPEKIQRESPGRLNDENLQPNESNFEAASGPIVNEPVKTLTPLGKTPKLSYADIHLLQIIVQNPLSLGTSGVQHINEDQAFKNLSPDAKVSLHERQEALICLAYSNHPKSFPLLLQIYKGSYLSSANQTLDEISGLLPPLAFPNHEVAQPPLELYSVLKKEEVHELRPIAAWALGIAAERYGNSLSQAHREETAKWMIRGLFEFKDDPSLKIALIQSLDRVLQIAQPSWIHDAAVEALLKTIEFIEKENNPWSRRIGRIYRTALESSLMSAVQTSDRTEALKNRAVNILKEQYQASLRQGENNFADQYLLPLLNRLGVKPELLSNPDISQIQDPLILAEALENPKTRAHAASRIETLGISSSIPLLWDLFMDASSSQADIAAILKTLRSFNGRGELSPDTLPARLTLLNQLLHAPDTSWENRSMILTFLEEISHPAAKKIHYLFITETIKDPNVPPAIKKSWQARLIQENNSRIDFPNAIAPRASVPQVKLPGTKLGSPSGFGTEAQLVRRKLNQLARLDIDFSAAPTSGLQNSDWKSMRDLFQGEPQKFYDELYQVQDSNRRAAYVKLMGLYPKQSSLSHLFYHADDPDPLVKRYAAWALGQFQSVENSPQTYQDPRIEIFERLSQDPDLFVRAQTAVALATSQDVRSLKILQSLLNDSENYVRLQALKSAEILKHPALFQPVLEFLDSEVAHNKTPTRWQYDYDGFWGLYPIDPLWDQAEKTLQAIRFSHPDHSGISAALQERLWKPIGSNADQGYRYAVLQPLNDLVPFPRHGKMSLIGSFAISLGLGLGLAWLMNLFTRSKENPSLQTKDTGATAAHSHDEHSHSHHSTCGAHGCSHSGPHVHTKSLAGPVLFVMGLTAAFAAVEYFFSFGSALLVGDALHMALHVVAYAVSAVAIVLNRRTGVKPAVHGSKDTIWDLRAAEINSWSLIAIGLFMMGEGIMKLVYFHPIVAGPQILLIAGIGLAVNIVSLIVTHHFTEKSLNMTAVLKHILADLLDSVAIITGILFAQYNGHFAIDAFLVLIFGFKILLDGKRTLIQADRDIVHYRHHQREDSKLAKNTAPTQPITFSKLPNIPSIKKDRSELRLESRREWPMISEWNGLRLTTWELLNNPAQVTQRSGVPHFNFAILFVGGLGSLYWKLSDLNTFPHFLETLFSLNHNTFAADLPESTSVLFLLDQSNMTLEERAHIQAWIKSRPGVRVIVFDPENNDSRGIALPRGVWVRRLRQKPAGIKDWPRFLDVQTRSWDVKDQIALVTNISSLVMEWNHRSLRSELRTTLLTRRRFIQFTLSSLSCAGCAKWVSAASGDSTSSSKLNDENSAFLRLWKYLPFHPEAEKAQIEILKKVQEEGRLSKLWNVDIQAGFVNSKPVWTAGISKGSGLGKAGFYALGDPSGISYGAELALAAAKFIFGVNRKAKKLAAAVTEVYILDYFQTLSILYEQEAAKLAKAVQLKRQEALLQKRLRLLENSINSHQQAFQIPVDSVHLLHLKTELDKQLLETQNNLSKLKREIMSDLSLSKDEIEKWLEEIEFELLEKMARQLTDQALAEFIHHATDRKGTKPPSNPGLAAAFKASESAQLASEHIRRDQLTDLNLGTYLGFGEQDSDFKPGPLFAETGDHETESLRGTRNSGGFSFRLPFGRAAKVEREIAKLDQRKSLIEVKSARNKVRLAIELLGMDTQKQLRKLDLIRKQIQIHSKAQLQGKSYFSEQNKLDFGNLLENRQKIWQLEDEMLEVQQNIAANLESLRAMGAFDDLPWKDRLGGAGEMSRSEVRLMLEHLSQKPLVGKSQLDSILTVIDARLFSYEKLIQLTNHSSIRLIVFPKESQEYFQMKEFLLKHSSMRSTFLIQNDSIEEVLKRISSGAYSSQDPHLMEFLLRHKPHPQFLQNPFFEPKHILVLGREREIYDLPVLLAQTRLYAANNSSEDVIVEALSILERNLDVLSQYNGSQPLGIEEALYLIVDKLQNELRTKERVRMSV